MSHIAVPMNMFDPNGPSPKESGIFGLPFSVEQAKLIYIPVPWDVTTSYRPGTHQGPEAILEASKQVDLFDFEFNRPYELGLAMDSISEELLALNRQMRPIAEKTIEAITNSTSLNEQSEKGANPVSIWLDQVNQASTKLNDWVQARTTYFQDKGQIPVILGGDHASPLGAFRAVGKKHGSYGILHFDAHADTRCAYEGFKYSHASIMYNALEECSEIKKLVQVGLRDFCEEEFEYCRSQGKRVSWYTDAHLSALKYEGHLWSQLSQQIVGELPEKVWISFDIDGLDPRYCPNTGTPVPGGLEYAEALYLISAIVRSGRTIIGFDLCEVAPGLDSEWDANVGARLLYKLSAFTLASQKLLPNK